MTRRPLADRFWEKVNGRAKLTEVQVAEIRRTRGLLREIAAAFGISKSQVSNIRRGDQWTQQTQPTQEVSS